MVLICAVQISERLYSENTKKTVLPSLQILSQYVWVLSLPPPPIYLPAWREVGCGHVRLHQKRGNQPLPSTTLFHTTSFLGHLRSSVCERIKLIIQAAKPQLQSHDNIPSSEVESSIDSFQEQLSQTLGQPLPSSIKEKTELLKVLLLTPIEM